MGFLDITTTQELFCLFIHDISFHHDDSSTIYTLSNLVNIFEKKTPPEGWKICPLTDLFHCGFILACICQPV